MTVFNDDIRKQLIDFLKTKLNIPFDGMWAHYYDEGCDNDDWYEDFCYSCEADSVEHGASKVVLFYDDLPQWVVKIPFRGEYIEEDDEYKEFRNANLYFPIKESYNYCEGEVYITERAKEAKLDEMFAKTYFLCEIEGTPIYVSEQVPKSRWWTYADWKDRNSSLSIADDIYQCRTTDFYNSCIDKEVIAFFVDIYGEEKTYDLVDFIAKYEISDLHNGNIGFTTDVKIKILDYSGFNS